MTAQASSASPRPFAVCQRGLAWAAGFSFVINLLMLALPLYMLQIFDRVLSSRSYDTLLVLFLLATVALAVIGALEVVRSFLLARAGAWLDAQLASPILEETIRQRSRAPSAADAQGLRDLTVVRTFLSSSAIFAAFDAPWTPIFLATIFLLNTSLGWLALVGAAILFALAIASEVTTRKHFARARGGAAAAQAQAQVAIRHADVVEAMGMRPDIIRRWSRRNHNSVAAELNATHRAGTIKAVSRFLRLFLQIAILTAGAWLVLDGVLTAGGMTAASLLLGRALGPVEQAIGTAHVITAAFQAYRRLAKWVGAETAAPGATQLPAPTGRLNVEGLTYTHPGARDPLLREISFEVPAGEAIGLIGPTAAGKTTLARLLLGTLQAEHGRVHLDGRDVAHWDRADIGRYVGYLPQTVELFEGTIHDNIARMSEGGSAAVIEAAQTAGVHAMILAMPRAYETDIGLGGGALSGGQRQRIGLARAVYGEPKIVILDEPNANLDGEGAAALVRALATLKKKGATVIVITHTPQILQYVDRLLVLRNGTITHYGPRDAVFAKIGGDPRRLGDANRSQPQPILPAEGTSDAA